MSSASDNTIFRNDVVDNVGGQAGIEGGGGSLGNVWDNGVQGNHWGDYLGTDGNNDGIGDTPYEANDVVDRLNWKYPLVKLLLNSPAVQSLRLIARQFPLLRGPSVVDKNPRMRPFRPNWSDWLGIQRD